MRPDNATPPGSVVLDMSEEEREVVPLAAKPVSVSPEAVGSCASPHARRRARSSPGGPSAAAAPRLTLLDHVGVGFDR